MEDRLSYQDACAYIDRLEKEHRLPHAAYAGLIRSRSPDLEAYLFQKSRASARRYFGNRVYIRGLIEFTNFCKNDCYYCGIRRGNRDVPRYRLDAETILGCARLGYRLGFRTFVLQGGEDPWFTDERMVSIVKALKAAHPDCAVTLSLGERSRESYRRLKEAGADRYLLRHETADPVHYGKLHPPAQQLGTRMECLQNLKELGYQVGTGFMVGSPYQTPENLAGDLCFIQDFKPQMVGIGPYLPHHQTPFAHQPAGSMELTLFCLGLLRLMLPGVLLPATTALGTIHPQGREKGILAGANVVMPNLSPSDLRGQYTLYDNKICTGAESAERLAELDERFRRIGYTVAFADRGDFRPVEEPAAGGR